MRKILIILACIIAFNSAAYALPNPYTYHQSAAELTEAVGLTPLLLAETVAEEFGLINTDYIDIAGKVASVRYSAEGLKVELRTGREAGLHGIYGDWHKALVDGVELGYYNSDLGTAATWEKGGVWYSAFVEGATLERRLAVLLRIAGL